MNIPSPRILAKYYIHGVAFSLLLTVASFFAGLLLAGLILIGAIIGLIIGLAIFFVVTGAVNALVTEFLWFPTEESWQTYLKAGFILAVQLIVVDFIIVFVLQQSLPSLTYLELIAAETIISAPFLGYLGRRVASKSRIGGPTLFSTLPLTDDDNLHPPMKAENPDKIPVAKPTPGSTEELVIQSRTLENLLQLRQKKDLLHPEQLDSLIEKQRQKILALRKSIAGDE